MHDVWRHHRRWFIFCCYCDEDIPKTASAENECNFKCATKHRRRLAGYESVSLNKDMSLGARASAAAPPDHISGYKILTWPPSVTSNKPTSVYILPFLTRFCLSVTFPLPPVFICKMFYNDTPPRPTLLIPSSNGGEGGEVWFDFNLKHAAD